ncbi:uncharacterized protein V2V93DRAFT_367040 [Kockiozyma suomiensis]|uniref:uncharacterized protein n=1 Tax=Kockiozyma suomiensis TaxID=1337062 RepID=UPI0033433A66
MDEDRAASRALWFILKFIMVFSMAMLTLCSVLVFLRCDKDELENTIETNINHNISSVVSDKIKLINRAGTGWTNSFIIGSIEMFGKLVIGGIIVYSYTCMVCLKGSGFLTTGTGRARLASRVLDGAPLLALYLAYEVLHAYGKTNAWKYDNGPSVQCKH